MGNGVASAGICGRILSAGTKYKVPTINVILNAHLVRGDFYLKTLCATRCLVEDGVLLAKNKTLETAIEQVKRTISDINSGALIKKIL